MIIDILDEYNKEFNITKKQFNEYIKTEYISMNYKEINSINIQCKRKLKYTEVILCLSGSLLVKRKDGAFITLLKDEVMIYTTDAKIESFQFANSFSGIIISMADDTYLSRKEPFKNMGKEDHVKSFLKENDYCLILRSALWIQSLFDSLYKLSDSDKCVYSVYKMSELFYLISRKNIDFFSHNISECKNNFISGIIYKMKLYMEEHIDEKLTIENVCSKFNVSPTVFKTSFKNIYGEPVHTWLQNERIKKSASYLTTTSMTVLEIAQAVGYEGTSQFNLVFKRFYGMTPSQYRKNVFFRKN